MNFRTNNYSNRRRFNRASKNNAVLANLIEKRNNGETLLKGTWKHFECSGGTYQCGSTSFGLQFTL